MEEPIEAETVPGSAPREPSDRGGHQCPREPVHPVSVLTASRTAKRFSITTLADSAAWDLDPDRTTASLSTRTSLRSWMIRSTASPRVGLLNGPSSIMNVSGGFSELFFFYYEASDNSGLVTLWSGMDGTGSMLGSIPLSATTDWQRAETLLRGGAMSVVFSGTPGAIRFDEITDDRVRLRRPGAILLVAAGYRVGRSDGEVPATRAFLNVGAVVVRAAAARSAPAGQAALNCRKAGHPAAPGESPRGQRRSAWPALCRRPRSRGSARPARRLLPNAAGRSDRGSRPEHAWLSIWGCGTESRVRKLGR